MRLLSCYLIAATLILFPLVSRGESPQAGDVIIRNGLVINGTGTPAMKADVLVRGDRIIAIQQLPDAPPEGVTIIDAGGRVVAPGFIDTAMTAAIPAEVKEKLIAKIPMKRMGTPNDIAAIVTFLSSDEASYVTGQCIQVDGALTTGTGA